MQATSAQQQKWRAKRSKRQGGKSKIDCVQKLFTDDATATARWRDSLEGKSQRQKTAKWHKNVANTTTRVCGPFGDRKKIINTQCGTPCGGSKRTKAAHGRRRYNSEICATASRKQQRKIQKARGVQTTSTQATNMRATCSRREESSRATMHKSGMRCTVQGSRGYLMASLRNVKEAMMMTLSLLGITRPSITRQRGSATTSSLERIFCTQGKLHPGNP